MENRQNKDVMRFDTKKYAIWESFDNCSTYIAIYDGVYAWISRD